MSLLENERRRDPPQIIDLKFYIEECKNSTRFPHIFTANGGCSLCGRPVGFVAQTIQEVDPSL